MPSGWDEASFPVLGMKSALPTMDHCDIACVKRHIRSPYFGESKFCRRGTGLGMRFYVVYLALLTMTHGSSVKMGRVRGVKLVFMHYHIRFSLAFFFFFFFRNGT